MNDLTISILSVIGVLQAVILIVLLKKNGSSGSLDPAYWREAITEITQSSFARFDSRLKAIEDILNRMYPPVR